MLQIHPVSRIEDVIFNRVMSYIPPGSFYLRAEYMIPRWGGDTFVTFVVTGESGYQVDIYLNNTKVSRLNMSSTQETVRLRLDPPPTVNYVSVKNASSSDSDGISVVVSNLASMHYGAALEYYRNVWLPCLYQEWNLKGDWGSRSIEFLFKYHNLFPDTQALRTLAVRLASKATWNSLPSDRGVREMLAALCCSWPEIREVSNSRPHLDLGLYPLWPISADYCGMEASVWYPDLPTAREITLLKLGRAIDTLRTGDFTEGVLQLAFNNQEYELYKDKSQGNLSGVLRRIGAMDSWKAWSKISGTYNNFYKWWDSYLDSPVAYPGLGATSIDEGTLEEGIDTGDTFASLWTGEPLVAQDTSPMDRVVQRAVLQDQLPAEKPPVLTWNYSELEVSCECRQRITNTLHGGAPPGLEVV